ncbi:type II secretion system minor pseudopilin GspJ [Parahaliea aestuarii]|uniref:Type II secretion system protein J n=1 Tax=Parahaliea aestuarii TaxID=1852021 RepID=A0A5C9A708_9GAMM|nr:type II secretion system minor pseudopilin GspJ [Parahaliea aestuarii]TXS94991.1 type II secretion system protein GspJ [Parahaliea aestuarii]
MSPSRLSYSRRAGGFTLVEVLIALAISAFIAAAAYTGLSTVMTGVERSRAQADRTWEINRALTLLSRDIRQFANRPLRDEFGDLEPALQGGPAARFMLSLTRAGWYNSRGHPRSSLERVNYVLEDEALWRESYPVLDRAANTEPQRVRLLDGVTDLRLLFLRDIDALNPASRGTEVDTRAWPENWVANLSQPDVPLPPPVALEVLLELEDYGELRRLYVLPPY